MTRLSLNDFKPVDGRILLSLNFYWSSIGATIKQLTEEDEWLSEYEKKEDVIKRVKWLTSNNLLVKKKDHFIITDKGQNWINKVVDYFEEKRYHLKK